MKIQQTLVFVGERWYNLIVKLDSKAKAVIEAILKRGNDAKIRRKGKGIVIVEEKQAIKYSTD